MAKTEAWRGAACSLMYTVIIYNVYILPTLSFISQLEPPPSQLGDRGKEAAWPSHSGPRELGKP